MTPDDTGSLCDLERSTQGDRRPNPLRLAACFLGRLLLRNRLAIAIASLLWLIYRSGTQPRRLSYPCQQVAAVNVGAFAAGLIPVLWLWRKPRCPHARRVTIRRQLLAAGILFVTALLGIEGYQYAQSLVPPALPVVPARISDPEHTVVGIAQRDPQGSWYTTAEIEAMVRLAIARSGGLARLMTDKNSDGQINVVLKPNLVQGEDPTDGVVTDPKVCAAIVKVAKEAGATHVAIAEGTAVGGTMTDRRATWDAMTAAGYDTNGDHWFDYDTSVPLYDLNNSGGLHQTNPAYVTLVNIPNGVIRNEYYVPNVLLNCDVLICVPTFKNHYNGTVTLALKNRIGCAPNDIYHSDFSWGVGFQGKLALVHEIDESFPCTVPPCPNPSDENEIVQRTIVDLNLVRPQDFAVVDGLIGVTTGPNDKSVNGHTGKPNPYMHMIVAGADSVAVDAFCSLAMDYNPDYIPHLAYADSRSVLGTKDRSMITPIGDQMWKIRSDDFPGNWGIGAVKNTDHASPTIGSVSVNEGDTIAPRQIITGSGIGDNVGVVQAAAVATLLGPNLLVNGSFESGADGWTSWKAGWGSGEEYDFASTEPGHAGNACLRLGGSAVASSFGVYQQVSVSPGKTYRIDAYWKGRKLADSNWFEVLLIDGPFSLVQADDPASAKANFMFAYDPGTYELPGPVGTTFGWVWGHAQYAPPANQVDWNNRLGRRTATGTTMTVVLKVGSAGGGVEGWFDEIRLTEVLSESPIGHVAHPTNPFNMEIETDHLPAGSFAAELRVTVYDSALNGASLYRNVTVQTVPEHPWACVDQAAFERSTFVGQDANTDVFHVYNCGMTGSTLNYTITWDQETVDWLTVVPSAGTAVEGGPPNPHSILYDTGDLEPGTHCAQIRIVGDVNAVTIAVTIHVTTVRADFDVDGDVDQSDFGLLQRCFGIVGTIPPACNTFDLDGDGFVERDDTSIVLKCMTGAEVFPDPDCEQ